MWLVQSEVFGFELLLLESQDNLEFEPLPETRLPRPESNGHLER
jgi:hypothetical protein